MPREKTVQERIDDKVKKAKEDIDAMKEPVLPRLKKKKESRSHDYYIQDYVLHNPGGH